MQPFARCASRRWLELSLAVLLLLSGLTANTLGAQGQPREGQSPTPAKNVAGKADVVPIIAALTVEGGGTLGAYEAGMTWALVEIFRQRLMLSGDTLRGENSRVRRLRSIQPIDFRAAAGASAGSINAFIAASRWCAKDSAETEKASPFWQVWIPMGVSELLPKKRPSDWHEQRAVLTREPFTPLFTDLDQMLGKSYYRENCSLLFGASITRLVEDSIFLVSNLSVRNQRYAAAFQVRGALGGAPGLTYSRLERVSEIPLGAVLRLPDSVGQKVIPYDVVHSLIKASSGFPLAFAPQLVSHCVPGSQLLPALNQGCPAGMKSQQSYFVDGGVFDNGPLTIGYGLALMTTERLALDSVYMLFLTPSRCRSNGCAFVGGRLQKELRHAQSTSKEEGTIENRYDGADAFAKLLAAAIPSARQYELQVMVRVLPTILNASHEIHEMRAIQDSLEGEVDRQTLRDSLEYEALRRVWIAARTDVGSLQTLNDSLRNALTRCRQLNECSAPEDSLLAAPPKLQGEWLVSPPGRVALAPSSPTPASTRRADIPLLLVSERWHPLAGDWLFGFGGFLGRPLREYDFYVGIYDALALVARRVIGADGTQFQEELKALVMEPPIVMTPTARVVLRALYNVEFSASSALPLKDGQEQPSVSDSLFIAVVNAMHEMSDSLPPERKCEGGPIERMECNEGLDVAFAAMRATPYFKRALRAANEDCAASNARKERCSDDERFDDFVHEPYSALNRLTGKVLERLLDATPPGSALKIPLTVASATYFSTNERARTGLDQGSVSLPPSLGTLNRRLMWLIPSSIGGYAGIPGWYYEWAGRWHLTPGVAIGATTRLVWASGLAGPESPRGRHTVPSFRVDRKFGGAHALLASNLGFDFSYWADWRHGGFRPTTLEKKAVSAAVTTTLFAQKLRLSFGYRPTKYVTRTRSKSRVLFSIGVGDVTGISYWLYRGFH